MNKMRGMKIAKINPFFGVYVRTSGRDIKKYDRRSAVWYNEVAKLLNWRGSLAALAKKYAKEDPDGCYDRGMSPAEFVAKIKKHGDKPLLRRRI